MAVIKLVEALEQQGVVDGNMGRLLEFIGLPDRADSTKLRRAMLKNGRLATADLVDITTGNPTPEFQVFALLRAVLDTQGERVPKGLSVLADIADCIPIATVVDELHDALARFELASLP